MSVHTVGGREGSDKCTQPLEGALGDAGTKG